VRKRITKIGKPTPDDEAAKRSGYQGDADTGDNRPCDKVIKHRVYLLRLAGFRGDDVRHLGDSNP
jgi:hypothetical protein